MAEDPRDTWFRLLSTTEANRTQLALEALSGEQWCRPLVRQFDLSRLKEDFYDPAKRPLMFEVRFAYEVHLAQVLADYEPQLGMGGSSVDFRLSGATEWRVELWSAGLTESYRESTEARDDGGILTVSSTPDANEEIRRLQTKIIAKVYDSAEDKPIKFPEPDDSIHAILVDARGYLQHGGDEWDYREVAYGLNGVRGSPWGSTVEGQPLQGVFEPNHPNPGAAFVRERVHFVGFVVEEKFVDREIPDRAIFCANPHLLATPDEANVAFRSCPLSLTRTPFYVSIDSAL